MKKPEFGFNKLQSFIDFFTTKGNVRFGVEDNKLYFENDKGADGIEPTKKYLSDDNSILLVDSLENLAFTGVIKFDHGCSVYAQTTISEATELTVDIVGAVAGYGAIVRLIGDGSTTPTFHSSFKKSSSSGDYDPTLDVLNLVTFLFDGVDFWYSIIQQA